MLGMLERETYLFKLIEASEVKSKSNPFQEWIFGQAKWACLSYRSLEGGTRVQQIKTGYFVAPVSHNLNFVAFKWSVISYMVMLSIGVLYRKQLKIIKVLFKNSVSVIKFFPDISPL